MTQTPVLRADLMVDACRLLSTLSPFTVEAWLSLSEQDARDVALWAASQPAWADWRVEAVGDAIRVAPALPIAPLPEKPAGPLTAAPPATQEPGVTPVLTGKMDRWRLLIGAPPAPPAEGPAVAGGGAKDIAGGLESPAGGLEEIAANYNFRLAAWRAGDPDPWAPFPTEDADRPNAAILRTIAPPETPRRRAADPEGVAATIDAWAGSFKRTREADKNKAQIDFDSAYSSILKTVAESREERLLWEQCVAEEEFRKIKTNSNGELTFAPSVPDIVVIQGVMMSTKYNEKWREFFVRAYASIRETGAPVATSEAVDPPEFTFADRRTLSAQAATLCRNAVCLALDLLGPETARAFAAELSTRIFDAPGSPYAPADAPLAVLAALAALPDAADEKRLAIQKEIRAACVEAWDGVSPMAPSQALAKTPVDSSIIVDFNDWPPLDPLEPIGARDGRKYVTFTKDGETTEIPWLDETLYDTFMDRLPANLREEDSDDENDWRPGDGALAVSAAWGVIDPWRTGPTEEAELALRVAIAKRMIRSRRGKPLTPDEAAREVASAPLFPPIRILPLIKSRPKPSVRAEIVDGVWVVGETNFQAKPPRRKAAGP